MDKIIIIGGGGLAKVVISILRKVNKYEICGYTDTVDRGSVLQVPYLGDDVFLRGYGALYHYITREFGGYK